MSAKRSNWPRSIYQQQYTGRAECQARWTVLRNQHFLSTRSVPSRGTDGIPKPSRTEERGCMGRWTGCGEPQGEAQFPGAAGTAGRGVAGTPRGETIQGHSAESLTWILKHVNHHQVQNQGGREGVLDQRRLKTRCLKLLTFVTSLIRHNA